MPTVTAAEESRPHGRLLGPMVLTVVGLALALAFGQANAPSGGRLPVPTTTVSVPIVGGDQVPVPISGDVP